LPPLDRQSIIYPTVDPSVDLKVKENPMHRSPKTALSVTWEVGTEHLPFVTKLSNFQNTKARDGFWV
jgi:hypothetical protein